MKNTKQSPEGTNSGKVQASPSTIREVAQAAGVSRTAVSKVLHGCGDRVRVSDEKAAAIREAAKRLDYKPNALARSLLTRRTYTIGLIFEHFWNISGGPLYYMHLLDGVASPLFTRHYRVAILPELSHENILDSLGDGFLEGVVWCKLARDAETLRLIHESPIPIVAMNASAPAEPTEAVFVSCDNDGGMELAVDHLWRLGHRRILFVHERQERNTPDCTARIDGFRAAVARRTGDTYAGVVAEWDWECEAFKPWWSSGPSETAIVCWTERLAGRILLQAQEHHVAVPSQLSVVGFDSTQFCDTTFPRLTAVRQPIFEMARCASETLLDMIRGQKPPCHSITFPCTFDVRESTSAPSMQS